MVVKARYGVQASETSATSYGYDIGHGRVSLINYAQRIDSENHPDWKIGRGRWDTGGFFDNRKMSISLSGTDVQSRYNFNPWIGAWQYDTHAFVLPSGDMARYLESNNNLSTTDDYSRFLGTAGLSYLEMYSLGAKAIAMVKPDNPTVDLATSLAELFSERKFFSVPGRSGNGLSGEYLNYQFGIAPTLSDAQDLRTAIENHDSIVAQYVRDSERNIRRKFEFDVERKSNVKTSSAYAFAVGAPLMWYQNPNPGRLVVTRTEETKSSFSGAFRYSIPKDALGKRVAELDRLYGIKPGIATAWELVPFSWLVDYFTPIGSLLDNIDSFLQNGLVLDRKSVV